jgi:hypothetical protein
MLVMASLAAGAYGGSWARCRRPVAAESGASRRRLAGRACRPENSTLVNELRQNGAMDVERRGQWRDGRWEDFDPLAPPVPASR